MTSFNVHAHAYFENVSQVENIFKTAISLNIVKSSELPSIPMAHTLPSPSPLIKSIGSGDLSNRLEKFDITSYFQKRRDSLFIFELSGKFIEITTKDLTKSGTFKYCRSAILSFSKEVKNILDTYGRFYMYSEFDSFDLKVGTDIRDKIIILTPDEYDVYHNEIANIQNWNKQILCVQSESARLKYRISELIHK